MQDFEIVKTSTGATSIRNVRCNEIMHNPVGPWKEANSLYIDQSKLRTRLQGTETTDLVVFDVGLGAGSNALAAMAAALSLGAAQSRRLHLVSFEKDLLLLKFAVLNAAAFDHMRGFEEALEAIVTKCAWESGCGRIRWELRVGDFLDSIDHETAIPEVIFFDPYSPNVNREMWTFACLEKIRAHCHLPEGPLTSTLYTYSRATPVRAAMLLAGFYVGFGMPTGLKPETTQASTQLCALDKPLDQRWHQRWQRSHTKLPTDATENHWKSWCQRVENHPQFAGLA